MTDDDDKIRRLGVRFKPPREEGGPVLKVVGAFGPDTGCNHRRVLRNGKFVSVQYLIRPGETEVECGSCGTKLDPMWVLKVLAGEESEWLRVRSLYQDEMKRLNERKRTKCDHCGKMTRISRS